jgi:hypothetical protein
MLNDIQSSSIWLMIDVVLVAILGIALAYGIMQWRKRSRNPAVTRASENATRRMYGARER